MLAEKLSHINSQLLRRVIELVEIEHLAGGELIYRKGEANQTAYLVLFGQVILFEGETPTHDELKRASYTS